VIAPTQAVDRISCSSKPRRRVTSSALLARGPTPSIGSHPDGRTGSGQARRPTRSSGSALRSVSRRHAGRRWRRGRLLRSDPPTLHHTRLAGPPDGMPTAQGAPHHRCL